MGGFYVGGTAFVAQKEAAEEAGFSALLGPGVAAAELPERPLDWLAPCLSFLKRRKRGTPPETAMLFAWFNLELGACAFAQHPRWEQFKLCFCRPYRTDYAEVQLQRASFSPLVRPSALPPCEALPTVYDAWVCAWLSKWG